MLQGAGVVYDGGESIRDLLAAEIRIRAHLIAQGVYSPSWSLGRAEARAALREAFTPSAVVVPRPDSTLLRVLAINDFHGALEPRCGPGPPGAPWVAPRRSSRGSTASRGDASAARSGSTQGTRCRGLRSPTSTSAGPRSPR